MDPKPTESPIHASLAVDESNSMIRVHEDQATEQPSTAWRILTNFHGGFFRICLSLSSQAVLWKTLIQPTDDHHALRHALRVLPNAAFTLLWSIALVMLALLSSLYALKCLFQFEKVKAEFLHHVGVHYLFVPWMSSLLLLQSTPFTESRNAGQIMWWVFVIPIITLDVKIYGQWFTKGKRLLSKAANPTSQLSVMANLVGARAAIYMGWKELALCLFSTGMAHYLVLFVTLYQRLPGSNGLPVMLRPVFFLFIATPSMASLAWGSINGSFDTASKMLFSLSLFLFLSLASRPTLFIKSMRRFSVAWWAYSFPITILAVASVDYARAAKGGAAHALMLLLTLVSVLVCFALVAFTALNVHKLFLGTNNLAGNVSSNTATA
ncbi:hypothetical protein Nepgr_009012 [Nepenthes gracilis]|uniref:S-type anion channel SLAH1 n=1 Tax=Nepenthes gracilis TaxID=150966 RepID=A0AAD3SAP2_NEPGR|nr:hypothetical protein Nepgr_009012 [Nepenthes gracilis]